MSSPTKSMQRPFEANSHDALSSKIRQADPPFPLTNPPVSGACLMTLRSLLTKDKAKRIGAAGFQTFTSSPFFRPINFVALENKELDPVFRPSSDKTNFDATYDLEELLLEEAPLEARARRQKPREQLKVDATREEIRADELHRMIEKLFEPFDYTLAQYDKSRISDTTESAPTSQTGTMISPTDSSSKSRRIEGGATPTSAVTEPGAVVDAVSIPSGFQYFNADSVKGSPPLPVADMVTRDPPRSAPGDYFMEAPPARSPDSWPQSRPQSSRSTSKTRRGFRRKDPSDSGGTDPDAPEVPPIPFPLDAFQAPGDGRPEDRDKKPSGMLAFLSRKKGRDRSPKAKERGVLGKEGARAIVAP
jgi:serine/threonine kinase 32